MACKTTVNYSQLSLWSNLPYKKWVELSRRQNLSNLPWVLLVFPFRGFFRKAFAACVVTLAASVCLKVTFAELSRETTLPKVLATVALAFAKAYHLKRPSLYDFAGFGRCSIGGFPLGFTTLQTSNGVQCIPAHSAWCEFIARLAGICLRLHIKILRMFVETQTVYIRKLPSHLETSWKPSDPVMSCDVKPLQPRRHLISSESCCIFDTGCPFTCRMWSPTCATVGAYLGFCLFSSPEDPEGIPACQPYCAACGLLIAEIQQFWMISPNLGSFKLQNQVGRSAQDYTCCFHQALWMIYF